MDIVDAILSTEEMLFDELAEIAGRTTPIGRLLGATPAFYAGVGYELLREEGYSWPVAMGATAVGVAVSVFFSPAGPVAAAYMGSEFTKAAAQIFASPEFQGAAQSIADDLTPFLFNALDRIDNGESAFEAAGHALDDLASHMASWMWDKLHEVFADSEEVFQDAENGDLGGLEPWYSIYAPLFDPSEDPSNRVAPFTDKYPGLPTNADPLVLDLDGGAFQLTALKDSHAHFDYAGNGFAAKTGWIAGNEGLLVRVTDNSGVVGAENLLGALSGNAFADLAKLDKNHDGEIDAGDAVFKKLRVWVDVNGDGVSTSAELKKLGVFEIKAINLDSTPADTLVNGNSVTATGHFVYTNGTTGQLAEVNFATDQISTVFQLPDDFSYSIDSLRMPELIGYGTVADLRVAATLDSTLAADVLALVTTGASMNGHQFDDAFEAIVEKWAGADGVAANSMGFFVDARHVYVVDAFYGADPVVANPSNPSFHAGEILEDMYGTILGGLKIRFLAQLAAYEALNSSDPGYDIMDSPFFEFAQVGFDPILDTVGHGGFAFAGTAGADVISGTSLDDYLYGWDGDDNISGGTGVNFLSGDAGNDVIVDAGGGSTIDGGKGSDLLQLDRASATSIVANMADASGSASDGTTFTHVETFQFTTHDDDDQLSLTGLTKPGTISWNAGGGNDHAALDFSAATTQVSFTSGGGGQFTGQAGSTNVLLLDVETASVIGGSAADYFLGGTGADTLTGSGGADTVAGLEGDDTIYGGIGNDIVEGDEGTNALYGGDGDDHIQDTGAASTIDGGTGTDILVLDRSALTQAVTLNFQSGKAYTLADGTFFKNVEALDLTTGSGDDSVSLYHPGAGVFAFHGGVGTDEATLDFSTATIQVNFTPNGGGPFTAQTGPTTVYLFDVETIAVIGGSAGDYFIGGTGDDTFIGNSGNDTIAGLEGNDTVYGGAGDDTVEGDQGSNALYGGDGDDLILDFGAASTVDGGAGVDTLRLDRSAVTQAVTLNFQSGKAYTLADGTFFKNVEALDLTTGSGDDAVTFYHPEAGEFAFTGGGGTDRTVLDFSTATTQVSVTPAGSDAITAQNGTTTIHLAGVEIVTVMGGSAADHFFGSLANDTFYGNGANDVMAGLDGDDAIYGGAGNDTVEGDGGSNRLFGGDGDDIILDEGNGSTIDGGTGNDRLSIDRSTSAQAVILNFQPGKNFSLPDGTTVKGIEILQLDTGSGNDGVIFSHMGAGINYFSGGGGTDKVTLDFATATTQVSLTPVGGGDFSAQCGATTIELFDVETIRFSGGSGDDYVFGGTSGDTLTGNVGLDTLVGGGGDDTIDGGVGNDSVEGDAGNDRITGGAGTDHFLGGDGKDRFIFSGASDSTGAAFDTIGDFDAKSDMFDVAPAVMGIDATVDHGALSLASFDANLAAAIDATHLLAGHAVVFKADSGGLAGRTFLVVDLNGTAGYQGGGDLVIDITGATHLANLGVENFI